MKTLLLLAYYLGCALLLTAAGVVLIFGLMALFDSPLT